MAELLSARRKSFRVRQSYYKYLLSYYVKSRLFNVKRPLLAGIKVTHECNLRCKHCPFWRRETKSISFSKAKESLKKLHELGARLLIIEGGEPFLWRDDSYGIKDIVDEAKKLFYNVGITTNGTFPLDIDTDILWVSLDGLKETHDFLRGHSFDRAVANIRESSHPNIYAHVTINSLNWREIPQLVRFLDSRVKGITIQFHYPYEEAAKELYLPFEKRRIVLDNLIHLKRKGFSIADSYSCLEALKTNRWKCRPWMIASVDPDGMLTHGCYVKNRGEISCGQCGFAAHTEISLAYGGVVDSIITASRIFL